MDVKTWPLHGRREAYTNIGIRRLPCFRCGKPAFYQWQICSDGNTYRPICPDCDLELNAWVLEFMGFDPQEIERKMAVYRIRVLLDTAPLTDKERRYLAYRSACIQQGYKPTIREVCAFCKTTPRTLLGKTLPGLQAKGVIE